MLELLCRRMDFEDGIYTSLFRFLLSLQKAHN
jgi:hypothetical protein